MTTNGDTFDTSPERVHKTPDREHIATENTATRLARRIARWLTGHHLTGGTIPPQPPGPRVYLSGHPDPYTDIDPYGHVLPPRPRNTP